MRRAFIWAILLTGCATESGVIPEGKDAYLLILSSGHGLASSVDLKIDAHKEANDFCMKLGKRPETIYEKTDPNGAMSDFHEEELKFKCVADPNISSASAILTAPKIPAAPLAPLTTPASAVTAAPAESH
jgi:hypothetical protein